MTHKVRLFQIVYSPETMASRDAGFEVLDNMSNERPDWFEYWPIRRYFAENGIEQGTSYGFFSPKFFAKTGLRRTDIDVHLGELGADDVVLFSPFPDQGVMHLNQIEQGERSHPGLLDLLAQLYPRDGRLLVQTTCTTSYCNYFVAGGAFWSRWLELADRLFQLAENPYSRYGQSLGAATSHHGRWVAPMKIFCIERLAGLMLADEERWRPSAPLAHRMPTLDARLAHRRDELLALDRLKQLAVSTGRFDLYVPQFLQARRGLRRSLSGERLRTGSGGTPA